MRLRPEHLRIMMLAWDSGGSDTTFSGDETLTGSESGWCGPERFQHAQQLSESDCFSGDPSALASCAAAGDFAVGERKPCALDAACRSALARALAQRHLADSETHSSSS